MVQGPVRFVALDRQQVASIREMWSFPGLAIGPIPTSASNKCCSNNVLQISGTGWKPTLALHPI